MISKNNATMLEEQGSSLHQRFTWFLPLFLPIIFCLGILSCEQESITDTDILKRPNAGSNRFFKRIE
ncbi:MAG: hypothetical protein IPL23_16515 [Saprospiraceae bacterium]|nr:hypothetical protein [Saprospiraceae bacterium]